MIRQVDIFFVKYCNGDHTGNAIYNLQPRIQMDSPEHPLEVSVICHGNDQPDSRGIR